MPNLRAVLDGFTEDEGVSRVEAPETWTQGRTLYADFG